MLFTLVLYFWPSLKSLLKIVMPSPNSKPDSPTQEASRSPFSRWLRRLSRSLNPEPESPRVVLGHDAIASLPTELNKLCLSSPLIIYSPSRISLSIRIRSLLPNLDARFITSDTHPGSAILSGRDCVISVGGPSAVAMARRISLKMRIPHICVPTTHNGAAGDLPPGGKQEEDRGSSKKSERVDGRSDEDDRSLPAVIIYDEQLTESPIRQFSAPSGVSADADASIDTEVESEADAAIPFAPGVATDGADADASIRRSTKSSTAQWSYIHLPGV